MSSHRAKKRIAAGKLTKNQMRKKKYAEERGKKLADSAASRGFTSRAVTSVKHPVPCGNIACEKCYERIINVGIVRR